MPYDPKSHSGRLKRLPPENYRGAAWVHWSMALENRKTGWLTETMHSRIRESLLHTLHRYHLICPVYCLMPDHGHFLLGGLKSTSDQRKAIRFFRKEWNLQLEKLGADFHLQKQPHDHVLTKTETARGAFEQVSHYILQNPRRAGLDEDFREWPFLGSLAVGYPDLDPRVEALAAFWEKFWRIYQIERDWEST